MSKIKYITVAAAILLSTGLGGVISGCVGDNDPRSSMNMDRSIDPNNSRNYPPRRGDYYPGAMRKW
ncbi:hypothetical protein [Rhizobium sp. BK251]|uniref:hypothetical protein n=1 Tax=Rhizobium sp. BK251 TaxID=2512125 RepID=UPI001044196D|nr:hypothetical protein [Rhizobium sp. BK251]TCL76075.1 hypothetical protein EV286_101623 [Rhizobium sp. BK251]